MVICLPVCIYSMKERIFYYICTCVFVCVFQAHVKSAKNKFLYDLQSLLLNVLLRLNGKIQRLKQ